MEQYRKEAMNQRYTKNEAENLRAATFALAMLEEIWDKSPILQHRKKTHNLIVS